MKNVWYDVKNRVCDQAWIQIFYQVSDRTKIQVKRQFSTQVWEQVFGLVDWIDVDEFGLPDPAGLLGIENNKGT